MSMNKRKKRGGFSSPQLDGCRSTRKLLGTQIKQEAQELHDRLEKPKHGGLNKSRP